MVGMSSSSCNYEYWYEKKKLGSAKRAAHQKFDVLDGHLFRDSYSPHSSFHRANPFGLSLRFCVPRSIRENARLTAVYHGWARVLGISLWRWVWILATQDADRNLRQVVVHFPMKTFNTLHAAGRECAPFNPTLFAKRRIMNKFRT